RIRQGSLLHWLVFVNPYQTRKHDINEFVLEEDPSDVDNEVVVPESLEQNTIGNNVANTKQQMVGGKNKEELKKSLQSVV
ncbi:hypothetical protein QQP08_009017, partial [Theobroma cacao]